MGNLGAGDVLTGELHPCLDFVFESVLKGVRVLLEHRVVVDGGGPGTKSAEGDFGGREVGLRLLHDAAERFERSAMRVDDGADAWVKGYAAEVFEPCDAHTFEAAIERAGEELAGLELMASAAYWGRDQLDGAEREGEVGDGPAQASVCADCGPSIDLGVGDKDEGWAESDDVEERGWITERASCV